MLSVKKKREKERLQTVRFPDLHLSLLCPTVKLCSLDLLGGSMRMQAYQAFMTHVRHELAFSFLMLVVVWQEGVCRGVTLEAKEGGACGSCKMPTGSHYTWVLSGSFRAPKTFLPLNGAFGKIEVHWNHKQTQERERKSERMKERKNVRGGAGRGGKREITTGSTQQQLRKRKFKVRTM